MKTTQYIVIGRYDCERNSWIEDGDIRHFVSGHRTREGAAKAADKAHSDLGGCDGSDTLSQVMRRLEPGESVSEEADTFEHAGRVYAEVSIWDTHEVVHAVGGLGLRPKKDD